MEKEGLRTTMNIGIENFGPIKKANFDIKPLTVFTGPNNSGKTYSSLLIHALTHYIPESQKGLIPDFWFDLTVKSMQKLLDNARGNVNNPEFHFLSDVNDFIKKKPSKSEILHIKKDSINFLIKEGIGKFYVELLQKKIESSFDSKLDKLVSHGNESFKISLNEDFEVEFSSKSFEIINFPKIHFKSLEKIYYPNIRFKTNEDEVLLDLDYETLIEDYDDDGTIVVLILMQVFSLVGTPILKKLLKNKSYYIPTIKSLAIKDLDVSKLADSSFHDLTERLESEIIEGNIIFISSDGLPEVFYESEEFKIPIHLASSSISELTPIFIYLKKILKKGDTLIMEEPEAHLHPKNQRVLVKYIVRLIKQGLNFIITTHSDYILEQVANMVLLKDVPEEDRINEFGYEKDDYLDREQVGIYLFEKKEFKSYTTNEIQIGKLGIPESSFTHVIDSLYGESHNIKKYLYG